MNLEPMQKAAVLIEALPYIQRFNRKIVVVKYGGSAMVDEELKKKVIQDVVLLKLVGFKPIIVHGGGKEISRWVGKVGMEAQFKNGLRVTDEPTMEIAEMVLNKVNKSLVQLVSELGINAVGISGKDGMMLKCRKKYAGGEDIGFVGDVEQVDATLLSDLIHKGVVPVMAPLTHDGHGNMLNTNADTIAGETAKALSALFDVTLVYCFEKKGVLRDENDDDSVIPQITRAEFEQYVADGVIQGGMIPKLENSFEAINAGVSEVVITLASAINNSGGTRIKK